MILTLIWIPWSAIFSRCVALKAFTLTQNLTLTPVHRLTWWEAAWYTAPSWLVLVIAMFASGTVYSAIIATMQCCMHSICHIFKNPILNSFKFLFLFPPILIKHLLQVLPTPPGNMGVVKLNSLCKTLGYQVHTQPGQQRGWTQDRIFLWQCCWGSLALAWSPAYSSTMLLWNSQLTAKLQLLS